MGLEKEVEEIKNPNSQFILGCMYQDGEGVQKDYIQAAKYYRLAALQGHAAGQYCLGLIYKYGHGVEKDYVQAMKYFRLAGDKRVGVMYHNGEGVTRNMKRSERWFGLD